MLVCYHPTTSCTRLVRVSVQFLKIIILNLYTSSLFWLSGLYSSSTSSGSFGISKLPLQRPPCKRAKMFGWLWSFPLNRNLYLIPWRNETRVKQQRRRTLAKVIFHNFCGKKFKGQQQKKGMNAHSSNFPRRMANCEKVFRNLIL